MPAVPAPGVETTRAYQPITAQERFDYFMKCSFGPMGVARGVFSAGWQMWRDRPEEWPTDASGFGKRFASRMGRGAITHGVTMGVGFMLHDDPRYYRAGEGSAAARLKHALVSTVVVRNQYGGRMPAYSRLAGLVAGNVIETTWLPPSQNSPSDALRRSASQVGFQVGYNIFKEFWPDIKRKLRH